MTVRKLPLTALAMITALALSGCGGVHSGGGYSRHQVGEAQHVSRATIVAMRDVRIGGSQSGLGQIGGGVIGGVAGSTLGRGTRASIAGAAVGGILGVVLGSIAENEITKTTATEFMLREESGRVVAVVQANDEHLQNGERVVVLHGSRVRVVRDLMPPASGAPASSPPAPGVPPQTAPFPTMPDPGRIIWNPPSAPS